ncbi:hypothetical protein [Burkholderia pyrrocinia]|uniref:hypothetical protein n=1 Tax=Burkholderia pyrrocinia TaxID=60550 RepID=UPI001FC7E573|nr:hypothetical protein [Burkholderia pyrrocinia]
MIDMTNPADVLHEVLDGELRELADALAACFALLPGINEAANRAGTMRAALVARFVFGMGRQRPHVGKAACGGQPDASRR